MSEFVEIFKIVLAHPSPLIMGMFVSVLVIYKSKDILGVFFDIKDMKKKRIIQKFEENKSLYEMNYLNPDLKTHYERLCEEAQIHAIIGCQYCSKEMAQYIMSREDISRAIRWYNRIKDKIEIQNQIVVPKKDLSDKSIKYLKILADVFYWILGVISCLGLGLVSLKQVFPSLQNLSWSYTEAIIFFITLLSIGLTAVFYTVNLELVKKFCTLKPFIQPIDENKNELSNDKVA